MAVERGGTFDYEKLIELVFECKKHFVSTIKNKRHIQIILSTKSGTLALLCHSYNATASVSLRVKYK
jgi:hypothetical protein